jgi:hypothetical protein
VRARTLVLIALTAFTAALGAAAILLARDGDGETYVSEHPVTVPETARRVVVSATMPMPSAYAHVLSAKLERGPMPAGPTTAEVLTDSECTPDAQTISRCRNEMRLADGRRIVLRHPHDMRSVPCLAPGERVLLMPV